MNSPQYEVELLNVEKDIKIIRFIAPELKKELDKNIKSILRPILVEAQSYLPGTSDIHPSGWSKGGFKKFSGIGPLSPDQTRGFVAYDGTRAKQGLKTVTPKTKRNSSGFVGYYGAVQRDTAGAIFETAGRGSKASRSRTRASRSKNPNASRDFIQTIERYYGVIPTSRGQGNDKGRALIRAFDNNRLKAFVAIKAAMNEIVKKTQVKLDNNAKEV